MAGFDFLAFFQAFGFPAGLVVVLLWMGTRKMDEITNELRRIGRNQARIMGALNIGTGSGEDD